MKKTRKVILKFDLTWGYCRDIVLGIAKYANLNGSWILYSDEPGKWDKALPTLDWNYADGIIAISRDPRKAKKLIPTGVTAIICDDIIKGPPYFHIITLDNKGIGKIAAEHLLERGFRRFCYLGFSDKKWSRERCEGFCKTITRVGFETYIYERPHSKLKASWTQEQARIADWLKSLRKPIGIMACDDDHGRRLIETCKIAHQYVPEEIAIVGVSNDELVCDLCKPSLSSVALNTKKAGYEAAELLDKLMDGKKMRRQKVIIPPTHVVTRYSSDILAVEDIEAAKAMRFIREHALEPIQVDDVVRAVGLSRRALQERFNNVFGRSIGTVIKHIRVEYIARLLEETNLTISQIASKIGFLGCEHISRYFKKEKGVSPVEYRKIYSHR